MSVARRATRLAWMEPYGVKSQYCTTWAGTITVPPSWQAAQQKMPSTAQNRGAGPTRPPQAPHVAGTVGGRLASVKGTWLNRGGWKGTSSGPSSSAGAAPFAAVLTGEAACVVDAGAGPASARSETARSDGEWSDAVSGDDDAARGTS